METITNIISGIIFWSFIIGSAIFGFLGYELGTYNTYDQCVHYKTTFSTPEYKYTFHNNVFYKVDKYLNPSKFDDVKYLEAADYKKDHATELKEYNLSKVN